ncbi:MAG: PhoH family protein [Planctomycetota bacterium]
MDISVRVPVGPERVGVLGLAERNLKMLREILGVHVAARDDRVRIQGERDAVTIAQNVLERLGQTRTSEELPRERVLALITEEADRRRSGLANLPGRGGLPGGAPGPIGWMGELDVYASAQPVRPVTEGQRVYLEAIRTHDLVFGIGPAGTGKTYLAVAAAVHLLKIERVKKLVLVRPAVEAGERLGFLPGDLEAKVNPYLRPLFDALHDMLDFPTIRRFMENDVVEVAPLAYMRGRTLNHAVVILDEAQNTTRGQMKMFLTRMGHGSKVIVTGDVSQIDLDDASESGLVDAARRLRRAPGVRFVGLDGQDVVRHELVQHVIEAYGKDERDRRHAESLGDLLDTPTPTPDPDTRDGSTG